MIKGLCLVRLRGEGSGALENKEFDVPTQRLIRSIGRQIGTPLHRSSSYYPHPLDNLYSLLDLVPWWTR